MPTPLMLSKRFAPLFWCQFLSAFRDNALRNALVVLILFHLGGPHAEILITLAIAAFIVPFLLISGLGGELADRFDKARLVRWLKFADIPCAVIAIAGFAWGSIGLLFVALLSFGTIAALFGPVRYGILPDHLAHSELPAATALIEGATFLAILLGIITGGLAARNGGDLVQLAAIMLAPSLAAWGASHLIPPTREAAPSLTIERNVIASTRALLGHLSDDRRLLWGAMAISWFWLNGVLVLALLPPLIKATLGGLEEVVTMALAVFSVGVAVGSGLAALFARGHLILWPMAVGSILIGACALDLGFAVWGVNATVEAGITGVLASPLGWRVMLDLAGLSIGGGFYIVPIMAAIQVWANVANRARVIAGVNVLSAGFMVGGSLLLVLLQAIGLGAPLLIMMLGACNLGVAGLLIATMPKPPASV